MIYLPIIQTVCFSLYVWYIVYHFGVIQSISQSWYEEGPTRKKFMFILFIISISVSTLILGILTKNVWFMACAGSLGIIGFAPAFRSEHKIVGILHTGGTVAGIAFACYALITHGVYFPVIPMYHRIDTTGTNQDDEYDMVDRSGMFQRDRVGDISDDNVRGMKTGDKIQFHANRITKGNPVSGTLKRETETDVEVELDHDIEGLVNIWYEGDNRWFKKELIGKITINPTPK